jgi:hypothetical protein
MDTAADKTAHTACQFDDQAINDRDQSLKCPIADNNSSRPLQENSRPLHEDNRLVNQPITPRRVR